MTIKLRKMGNLSAVILSKDILDLCQITDEDNLKLSVQDNKIVIEKATRANWGKLFELAGKETSFLEADLDTQFEDKEWTW